VVFRSLVTLVFVAAASVACDGGRPEGPQDATSEADSSSVPSHARCEGVTIAPDANIQALIDANPPRTTFCFATAVYRLTRTILTRNRYPTLDLRAGAVIDGQNGGFAGITGEDAPTGQQGLRILGGIFQHFGNSDAPSWVGPLILHDRGVVEGTEFRENFNAGLSVQGDGARVSGVHTHHNGRYGLVVNEPCRGCPGPKGVIIEDSEIAYNNTRKLATSGDSGGTKFAGGTDGMVVRRNEVHHNFGAGLWWDGFNTNAQVYDNIVHDNTHWGIFWEFSYGGAKIHDNTLTDNGLSGSANFFDNVQLLVSCSDATVGGIDIYQNTIDGEAYPLGLLNHDGHPTRTRNVFVHHNVMTLRASGTRVGAFAADGLTELFGEAANNRFDYNTYRLPDLADAYWTWDSKVLTWSQWRAYGQDVNGTSEQIA
jgi:parallel beta-helix repeat protein